jgi:hypothetical protein
LRGPGATGNGTPRATGLGGPGATRRRASAGLRARRDPEPPGKGRPRALRCEEAPSHPAKGKPRATGQRRHSEPPAKRNFAAPAWGQPRAVGNEKTLTHPARGTPEPLVIRATGAPVKVTAPVGGRAAQRTLSNRRDGAARQGEAPPSHTWRGLVLLCPTRQNHARTDTPPVNQPFPQPPPCPEAAPAAPYVTNVGRQVAEEAAAGYPIGGRPTASSPACHTAATRGTPGR